jgi:hypothetical protein
MRSHHILPTIVILLAIATLAGATEEIDLDARPVERVAQETASGNPDDEAGARVLLVALVPAVFLLLAMPFALFLASSAPGLTVRATGYRQNRPIWTFVLGLLDVAAFLALATALAAIHPWTGIVTLLIAAGLVSAAVVGLVGTARGLGDRLLALGDLPVSDLRRLCWGWLLLAGIPLLPVLGALVLLYLAFGAIGAGHLAWHGRGK